MAITQNQIVDYLYKKLGYGVAKTDYSSAKSPSNETIPSPLLTTASAIWQLSDEIPVVNVPPTSNSSVVTVYNDTLGTTVTCRVDPTTITHNETWLTELTDWIPAEFGSGYQVQAYAAPAGTANPVSHGVWLPPHGSGHSDSWFFDYQSGVLNFADTNIPAAVAGNVVYVTGARYTGQKGLTNFPHGVSLANLVVSGNAVINGGITSSNGGAFFGNALTGAGAIYGGINPENILPGAVLQITGNINGTPLANFQNIGTGTASTANVTVSTNTANVVLGIASNTFNQAGTIQSNDAYLLLQGNTSGNLILGTSTAGSISFITSGGQLAANLSAQTGLEIYANAASTSDTTGAVVVAGGVGVTGNINAGGNITAAGDFIALGNAIITGSLVLQGDISSTSSITGELVIGGGLGVGGNVNAAGGLSTGGSASIDHNLTVLGNTASTSTDTGALVLSGGLGLAGNVNAGGNLTAQGDLVTLGNASIIGNISSNGNITVTINTPSVSYDTGALVIAGGAGIGGDVNVQGNVSITDPANSFYGNVHADSITSIDGDITLAPTNGGITAIASDSALQIPVGNTLQRPVSPSLGYIRYNTDLLSIEYWDGTQWISTKSTIFDQTIVGDGETTTYALDRDANATGILVTINGTTQRPDDAYTVVDREINFAEAPLPTDIVDVRFLATSVSVNINAAENLVFGNKITVGRTPTVIDNFLVSEVQSAKYIISSTNGTDAQMSEIMLLQYAGNVQINTYGVLNTGENILTFTANISGGSVNLLAQGTSGSDQVLVQRTYFSV